MEFLESDQLYLPVVVVVNVSFGESHVANNVIVLLSQALDSYQEVLSVVLETLDVGFQG